MTEKREEETVEPVLQEIYVKLAEKPRGRGRFQLPRAIANYYKLQNNDGLVCELVELRDTSHEKVREIKKEILVDVCGDDPLYGEISEATWSFLELKGDWYALLKIKQAVKK